jgi:uroporphyrinogen-III synthase
MKTVAVTTSSDRAAAAAIPFTLAGTSPISLPCIEIVPVTHDYLEEARAGAIIADLIIVSSRRTLDILWPDGPLPTTDFAVVGRVTAREVEKRGGAVALVGSGGSDLLADALAGRVAGKSVIWPHARGADPRPLNRIRAGSTSFMAPVIYESVPKQPAATPVDVVTFASPSAVAGWQLSRSLQGVTIAVIGETTRAAVDEAGAPVAVIASEPTYQSLANSVAQHLGVSA